MKLCETKIPGLSVTAIAGNTGRNDLAGIELPRCVTSSSAFRERPSNNVVTSKLEPAAFSPERTPACRARGIGGQTPPADKQLEIPNPEDGPVDPVAGNSRPERAGAPDRWTTEAYRDEAEGGSEAIRESDRGSMACRNTASRSVKSMPLAIPDGALGQCDIWSADNSTMGSFGNFGRDLPRGRFTHKRHGALAARCRSSETTETRFILPVSLSPVHARACRCGKPVSPAAGS